MTGSVACRTQHVGGEGAWTGWRCMALHGMRWVLAGWNVVMLGEVKCLFALAAWREPSTNGLDLFLILKGLS